MGEVLQLLKSNNSQIEDEDRLLDSLENAFEESKMFFKPEDDSINATDMRIPLPGLLRNIDIGMPREHEFRVQRQCVESQLFEPQLQSRGR
jgi:hypothetical protein